ALDHLGQVLLTQVSVDVGGTGLSAVSQCVDSGSQHADVEAGVGWVDVKHLPGVAHGTLLCMRYGNCIGASDADQVIIGGAACRPGASQGNQITATARASAMMPASRPAARPRLQVFSTSTTAARPTMAAMFITPAAMKITMRPQQQPRQYPP